MSAGKCALTCRQLREFSVTLDLPGYTAFALAVWAAANRIAYGPSCAPTAGSPSRPGAGGAGIYQAVGSALGANPVPLIIPVIVWSVPTAVSPATRRGGDEGAAAGPGRRSGGVPRHPDIIVHPTLYRQCCTTTLSSMRIAAFGDIHGNLFALQAVLADLRTQKPDGLLVTGDLVYKFPWGARGGRFVALSAVPDYPR